MTRLVGLSSHKSCASVWLNGSDGACDCESHVNCVEFNGAASEAVLHGRDNGPGTENSTLGEGGSKEKLSSRVFRPDVGWDLSRTVAGWDHRVHGGTVTKIGKTFGARRFRLGARYGMEERGWVLPADPRRVVAHN